MRIRPIPAIVIGLTAMGFARGTLTMMDLADGATPVRPAGTFLVGAASAAASKEAPTPPPAAPAPKMSATPAAAESCAMPEEMLQAIAEERDLLISQNERLDARAAEIDLANEKLEIERGRLDELKTELEALLTRVEEAQTADVSRLVALYSNMKPKEAATIMNDLDIEVSVMVMGTMPEREAAPILANLNPVRARAISRILLERSKLPGDQRLDNLKF